MSVDKQYEPKYPWCPQLALLRIYSRILAFWLKLSVAKTTLNKCCSQEGNIICIIYVYATLVNIRNTNHALAVWCGVVWCVCAYVRACVCVCACVRAWVCMCFGQSVNYWNHDWLTDWLIDWLINNGGVDDNQINIRSEILNLNRCFKDKVIYIYIYIFALWMWSGDDKNCKIKCPNTCLNLNRKRHSVYFLSEPF